VFNIKIPFVIASHGKKYAATTSLKNKSKAFAIGMVGGLLFAHDGTAVRQVSSQAQFATITGDGAVSLVSGIVQFTKGSAAAITIAAPGAGFANLRITMIAGSDFAHVVTFTGGTLWDGTTGANTTVTMTAFKGSSLTVVGLSATLWAVESQNTLTSIA
jgi:hypothetical protein